MMVAGRHNNKSDFNEGDIVRHAHFKKRKSTFVQTFKDINDPFKDLHIMQTGRQDFFILSKDKLGTNLFSEK